MINLMPIQAGTRLRLNSGAVAEVVENIGDGQWVNIRYLESPDSSAIGEEELCHASDIAAVLD